jgi:hypothetical protein
MTLTLRGDLDKLSCDEPGCRSEHEVYGVRFGVTGFPPNAGYS